MKNQGGVIDELQKRGLFNERGDIELSKRRIINGNTINLDDFNNIKYSWTSEWCRQAMNNFWTPKETSLNQDIKDYRNLSEDEKIAYDKILSLLTYLDSLQIAQLPDLETYITTNEVNLCLSIQAFQESIHSQSYSYILDTICSPEERTDILYQWEDDEFLLKRNRFIGDQHNDFFEKKSKRNFMKALIANYISEGIYFYSGFILFYNLGRMGEMPGAVQEIRHINRDENIHLWLFRSMTLDLKKEHPELFTEEKNAQYKETIKQGAEAEIEWAKYVIDEKIQGLSVKMVEDYIKYLDNLRSAGLGFGVIYPGYEREIPSIEWVGEYSDPNKVKTDFFEVKLSAYPKSAVIEDDL